MIVALVGDLEGEQDAAVAALRSVAERGGVEHVLQLGDLRYGYGPGNAAYLDAIEDLCTEHGLRFATVTGNHENWALLDELWADRRWQHPDGRPAPVAVSDRVTVLPRGHRWQLGGRSFVALGSAPSVNRHSLTEGVDWWPTEALREEHVDLTVSGGYAEVMLTHDSPGPPWCTDPVRAIIEGNPWGWPDDVVAYASDGVDKLTRAVLGVRPRLLAHGHFHVPGETTVRLPGADHDTTVWSLAARRDPGVVRFLDLVTLTDPDAP